MHSGLIRVTFLGGMTAPKQNRWPKYDLGAFPVCTDTMWNEYGGGEGAEYLGTMIISGGLAGEHGVPGVNNPMEVSVVEVGEKSKIKHWYYIHSEGKILRSCLLSKRERIIWYT